MSHDATQAKNKPWFHGEDPLVIGMCEGTVHSNVVMPLEIHWDDFVGSLRNPGIGDKDGPYITRAAFRENRRSNDNALTCYLLLIDGDSRLETQTGEILDGAPDPFAVHEALKAKDVTHCIYSSWSNQRPGKGNRYRVAIPVLYETAEELEMLVTAVIAMLAREGIHMVNVTENLPLAQPWYLPRLPSEEYRQHYVLLEHDGLQPFPMADVRRWWKKQITDRHEPQPRTINTLPYNADSPIGRFNTETGVEGMLKMLTDAGYVFRYQTTVNGQPAYRFMHPESSTQTAGVVVYQAKTGPWRAYSHHGPYDPLAGKAEDAFGLSTLFQHGGNQQAALEAIGVVDDYASMAVLYGMERPEAATDTETGAQGEHADPENVFEMPTPTPLNLNAALPGVLAKFARSHAFAAGKDPGAYAYAAVTACSSVIKHSVRVKLSATWKEPILVWSGIIGGSGSGKSPSMDQAVEPVQALHLKAVLQYKADWKAWKESDGEKANEPTPDNHYFSNTTIEALTDRASMIDHQVLRHADEGTGWINAMGRYANSGSDSERGDWLAAWQGKTHTVARISRGDRTLAAWGVAVLYGMTPGKMKGAYEEAASDGLLARTLLYVLDTDLWVKENAFGSAFAATQEYQALITRLAGIEDITIELSTAARELWRKRKQQYTELTRGLEEHSPGLTSFCGKATSNMARIAGLFHLVEGEPAEPISKATMEKADLFMRHALGMAQLAHLHVFSQSGVMDLTRAVAGKILTRGENRITRRDLQRHLSNWNKADKFDQAAALKYLAGARWLTGICTQRLRLGPRFEDATGWIINPRVHELFAGLAEQQRQKELEIHQMLKELGSHE